MSHQVGQSYMDILIRYSLLVLMGISTFTSKEFIFFCWVSKIGYDMVNYHLLMEGKDVIFVGTIMVKLILVDNDDGARWLIGYEIGIYASFNHQEWSHDMI